MVRRFLPGVSGPSGAPAMTDLLGVCVSWQDGECVVQPETGPAVRIPWREIVSGKPVPPRPSVRHRVGAREAEGHALVLWPTVHAEPLGAWVLRSETEPVGRLLKRANSCLALGDPGLPLGRAAERVEAFYADRGRDALAQVEVGSPADLAFSAAGWSEVDGGASLFLVGSVARALRALQALRAARGGAAPAAGEVGGAGGAEVRLEEDGPRALVELRLEGDEPVATGRAALDDDWLGLYGLQVDPDLRRRGLAGTVLAELLDWGASQGATTVWLHVETDNHAALALYGRLGLSAHHELRYLRAPH